MVVAVLTVALFVLGFRAASGSTARYRTADTVAIISPDGNVQVRFALAPEDATVGAPLYNVTFRGRPVITESRLGMDLAAGGPLGSGLHITGVKRRSHDSTYSLFPGKTSRARDHYNEAEIALEETAPAHRRFHLTFRAYDDGVAFRYRFPRQPAIANFTVARELSTFALAGNPRAYALRLPSFTTPYEAYYQTVPVRSISPDSLIALPLLVEYPDHLAVALTEADLTDYAGMYLSPEPGRPGAFVSRLSPLPGSPRIAVKASLPHSTPWRVIMIGPSPGRLIESNLITSLSPPSAIADTSWIHPGKTTFPWWNGYAPGNAGFPVGLNTATMKYYIDFCAENHIPYHTLDGFDSAWYGGPIAPYAGADITSSLPAIDLPEVIAYARKKGVRLRLWMHSAAALKNMEHAFPLYEKWGIEGVMVDFVERDDQDMIRSIHDMVALAAKHHLTVTLHNISKPTGLSRTYPNLLTLESVMNLEYDKWDPKGSTPEHELIVPFTRMLAGPLDYHSGSFRNVTEKQFKPQNVAPVTVGTRARQLARYVVYEDYLPMVADSPDAYRGQPGLDLLTEFPTTWDETKVLNGEVGQYITIARRSGRQWYVGSMTDSRPRTLALSLSFLPAGSYRAEVYSDDPTRPDQPTLLQIKHTEVTRNDRLTIEMAPAGGYVLRLTPR